MAFALALALSAQVAGAQTPPQSADQALLAMEQLAGVIFTGQVVAVHRTVGTNGATGVVEIDFAVGDAIRGVSGSSYALREWAGLWPAGDEPFQIGQSFLMLLYAPSAAGLSSPVGGMDGAIPIRGVVVAPNPAGGLLGTIGAQSVGAGGSVESDGLVVDLSWVQTEVERAVSYRAQIAARPTALPTGAHAEVVAAQPASSVEAASGSLQVSSAEVSAPAMGATTASAQQSEPYAAVMGKLRGWVKDDNAPR
jgi:hypothetical protein